MKCSGFINNQRIFDRQLKNYYSVPRESKAIRGKLHDGSPKEPVTVMFLEYLPLGDFCSYVQSEGPGPGGQGTRNNEAIFCKRMF